MEAVMTMDVNRVVERLARAERHNGRLRGEVKLLRGRAAELEQKAAGLQQAVERLKAELAEMTAARESCWRWYAQADGERAALQARLEQREAGGEGVRG